MPPNTLEDLFTALPRAADGTGILDKRNPAYLAIQGRIAELLNYKDPAQVNLAFGQVSPKISCGPAFFREGYDDPLEIFMLRTVQQQIGLGGPAKWMIGGGGFINSKAINGPAGVMFESPAMNANRTCKLRLGFDLKLPLNTVWVPITKQPYDVTNETNVHGIIFKAPLYMSQKAARLLEAAAATVNAVGRWFGPQEFSDMVASGDHTMDVGEIDFVHGCMDKQYALTLYQA